MFDSPEHSLRALVQFSPLGIVEINAQRKVKLWNPAAERMYGWAESEVLGREYPAVRPENRAEYEAGVLHILEGSTIQGKDVRRQRKDGRQIDVRLWAAPIHNEQGEITGITAILEDITDQKENQRKLQISQAREEEMEARLQRDEERMRLAFDAAKIGFWDWNIVTGETVWSATASRQMGLPENSPTSFAIFINAIHPDDRKTVQESIESAVRDNTDHAVEYRVVWPDGNLHWRLAKGRAIYDTTGRPVRMTGIAVDIDDRKAADERLLSQAAALQAAANAIVLTDNQGTILRVNPAFTQMTGYAADEAIGKNPRLLKSGKQDSAFYTNMWATITAGNAWHGELTNRRKDGSLYTEEMTIAPVRSEAGAISHYVAIKQDITQRKLAERALQDAEQKYRRIFENTVVGIFQTTLEGEFLSVNPALALGAGYDSPEDFLGHVHSTAQLYVGQKCRDELRDLVRTQRVVKDFEAELKAKDGSKRWVSIDVGATPDREGTNFHLEGTVQDITQRKRAEEALHTAEQKYRSIFENAVLGIFQTTLEGEFLSVNPALARMAGYDSPEDFCASVPCTAQLYIDPKRREQLRELIVAQKLVHDFEVEFKTKEGGKRTTSVNVRVTPDRDGTNFHLEGTVQDITERKAAEAQVQFLAYYDALTGLPNRTLLRDRILVALAGARRHREKVALLFLDLDHFKTINDSLGHSIGDQLLKEVAERLKKLTREPDTVARLGGDEFLVLMTDINETAEAVLVAERIVDAMAAEFVIQGHLLNVSCSLGISIFPDDGEEAEALFKNADLAMYDAKEHGRNNVRLFTPEMNIQAVERMTLENSLRSALERSEFYLVYQPQADLATGEIIGCEALIRWRHPELGVVPPNKFIPIAESSGLIIPIGEWVLRTACAQARQWQDQGLLAVPVAVNVSAVQFQQKDFLRLIETVLRESRLAPQYLELELTESLILSNADVVLFMLQQLREMGVRLSIDDFGTGYSSLSYLKQFPVYKLKIDGSFVRDVDIDPDDAAIIGSILVMAKSLGLKVVAECVENEEQVSFLRAHHCDEIQGYYFSRPLPADELGDKLRSSLRLAASPGCDRR